MSDKSREFDKISKKYLARDKKVTEENADLQSKIKELEQEEQKRENDPFSEKFGLKNQIESLKKVCKSSRDLDSKVNFLSEKFSLIQSKSQQTINMIDELNKDENICVICQQQFPKESSDIQKRDGIVR